MSIATHEGLAESYKPWPIQEVLTNLFFLHTQWTLASRREFEGDSQLSGHIDAVALVSLELASYLKHLPADDPRFAVFEQFPSEAWSAAEEIRLDVLCDVADQTTGKVSPEMLDKLVTTMTRLTLSPSYCVCCDQDDVEEDVEN